jgi:hypothetical protein
MEHELPYVKEDGVGWNRHININKGTKWYEKHEALP